MGTGASHLQVYLPGTRKGSRPSASCAKRTNHAGPPGVATAGMRVDFPALSRIHNVIHRDPFLSTVRHVD